MGLGMKLIGYINKTFNEKVIKNKFRKVTRFDIFWD
jgi:hypothetical protein